MRSQRKPETEGQFYSLGSLAKRWETSYRNLHRKALEGKLRVIRLGALIRVPRDEVVRVEQEGFSSENSVAHTWETGGVLRRFDTILRLFRPLRNNGQERA